MPGNGKGGNRGRGIMLIALAFLALAAFRPAPMGLNVAVNRTGMSFRLTALFVKIAFDFGQECPKSNSCTGVVA